MKNRSVAWLAILTVVFLIVEMQAFVVLGNDQASLSSVIADPVIQSRVLSTAKRSTVQINNPCPSAQFILSPNLLFYKPLARNETGDIISGAWKQVVQEHGCGASRTLNVLAFVKGPKALVITPLLPGTTHADPILQKDAVKYAVIAAGGPEKNCSTGYVADTKFLQHEGAALKDSKGPPWREEWTLITCSKKAFVQMHFIPDSTGTSIVANPSETRILPIDTRQ